MTRRTGFRPDAARSHRRHADARLLTMRDMVDAQVESLDGRKLGRVADLEGTIGADGTLRIVALLLGPEAQLGAVSARLRRLLHGRLKGRFDHRIEVEEIEEVGPTVKLRQPAEAYGLDGMDRWLVDHLLRFIPGNGKDA